MRNISFKLTTDQIRNRTKTVTRRLGWKTLTNRTLLQACVKCQGLKPGERVERLCMIRVVSVTLERLTHLLCVYSRKKAKLEVVKEGFPDLTPREFVAMFCREMKCDPEQEVTRIEFEYVD